MASQSAEQANLPAMERVRLARHPDRPYMLDFVETIFEDFIELHGDRRYADDPAVVCGFARLDGQSVLLVGQQKGRNTKQRQYRNFGMPKPEGYRKALRLMQTAEKFNLPILLFVDTPGAYPGIDAEERGQAEAIAYNLREMVKLKVPIIAVVIGEGGSGGALAIAVADSVMMLENAIYSVISPEGCAAILWKDAAMAPEAATQLHLTAQDLLGLGIVDQVISEPGDGAQADIPAMSILLKNVLKSQLTLMAKQSTEDRAKARYEKWRNMGVWGLA
ncbi:MAG: acetyl-CoA carboxylase carboxyltransferase subunit alpha [Pyrinomonadaceae bacterium]